MEISDVVEKDTCNEHLNTFPVRFPGGDIGSIMGDFNVKLGSDNSLPGHVMGGMVLVAVTTIVKGLSPSRYRWHTI